MVQKYILSYSILNLIPLESECQRLMELAEY